MTAAPAHRRVGPVAVAAVLVVLAAGACSVGPTTDSAGVHGEPTSIPLDTAALATVTSVSAGVDLSPDACALVAMGPARVGELTGVPIEWTDPVGRPELHNHCTYGGPPPTHPGKDSGIDGDPAADARVAPNTVSLAVSVPRGDVVDAVAAQAAQVAALYRCSALRGSTGGRPAGSDTPGAPAAPASPKLPAPHVDCAASPSGGGSEAHVIVALGGRVWHLMAGRPSVPRTPESERALVGGLYRLAAELPA